MSQDSFLQKKQVILKNIQENSPYAPDLSPKGTIDELCMPLIDLINSSDKMVTTSSCSGRISVFLEGSKVKILHQDDSGNIERTEKIVKSGGKGEGGKWIFVTHNVNDVAQKKDWYKSLNLHYKIDGEKQADYNVSSTTRYLLYKFEPLIYHVLCKDFDTATKLYTTAMNCGFRESGIGKNNNVAIRTSIKLDMPIGYLASDQKITMTVDENFMQLLTSISIDKFKQNEKKTQDLYESITNMIQELKEAMPSTNVKETKEERRQRKIKEGLRIKKLKELERLQKELQTEN